MTCLHRMDPIGQTALSSKQVRVLWPGDQTRMEPAEGDHVIRQSVKEIGLGIRILIVPKNSQVCLNRTSCFFGESLLIAKRALQKVDELLKPSIPVLVAVTLGFPAKLFDGTHKLALHCVALAGLWNELLPNPTGNLGVI